MHIILAILVVFSILAVGVAVSMVLPRFVRWDYRTVCMVSIWVISLVIALIAGVSVA